MIGQGVTVHVQTQIATNMHELARFGHTSVLPGHRILGSNFPAHGNSKMMSLQRVVCRSVSLTRSHSTTPFLFPTAARFPSARHFATSGKPKSRGEIDEDVEDEKMLMGSLIGKQKLNSLEDQFDVLAGDLDEMLDRKTNPPARAPSSPAANPPKPDTKEVEQSLVEDKDAASSEEPLSEDELRLQKKEERKKHIYVDQEERIIRISKAPLTMFASDVKNFLEPEVQTLDIVQEVALGLKPTGVWLAKVTVDSAGKAVRKNRASIGPVPVDVARTSVRVWKDATSVIVQIPDRMRSVVLSNIPPGVNAFTLKNLIGNDVDCRLIRLQTAQGANKTYLVKCRTTIDAQLLQLKLGGCEIAPGTKVMVTLLA